MEFVAPRGYQPVYDPSIPYMGHIRGGLREGTHIYIAGSIPENISMFVINLRCDMSETSDIAMHMNPRFDGWDKVVFNCFEDDSWGSEEKLRRMPFVIGEAFEMVIMVTSQGYKVHVNGEEYYTFDHRIPLRRVRVMNVTGDVSIHCINFIAGGMERFPDEMEEDFPGMQLPSMEELPILNPTDGYTLPSCDNRVAYEVKPANANMTGKYDYKSRNAVKLVGLRISHKGVPCAIPIPRGMHQKRTVIIRGMVPFNADRIRFNFMRSSTRDVAFHLNPRVQEGVIVRNSKLGGDWGAEERKINYNPFREGEYFDMSIRCGSQKYKVFVNGQHLCDYPHRLFDFDEIDMLEIDGDVQISYIHL